MLTSKLQIDIDKKWEACWPVSQMKPLLFIDLLSYLLFFKKLEESVLIPARRSSELSSGININEGDGSLWSRFKDLDAQSMYSHFTKKNGVLEFLKNYGDLNRMYSWVFKEPLLLIPSAGLLANTVDLIKNLEREDHNTQGEIFEYLLNKAGIVGQNGQVNAPGYAIELITRLIQPKANDVILDYTAGNGSLLINCAKYIAGASASPGDNLKRQFFPQNYKGIEGDRIQLRIGAMNMILHGIENPALEFINGFNETNTHLRQTPTLVLANLLFRAGENSIKPEAVHVKREIFRAKEIEFLHLILKNLQKGARAAIIVPDIILYDNNSETKTIRKQIIEEFKLEAVISLRHKSDSAFTDASLLIFTLPEKGITDRIWFYKMKAENVPVTVKNENFMETVDNANLSASGEDDEIKNILNGWQNKKEIADEDRTGKSFYVGVDELKDNNYNLSFNVYKNILKAHILHKDSGNKREIPYQVSTDRVKQKSLIKRAVSIISILAIGFVVFYLFYFKDSPSPNLIEKENTKPARDTISAPATSVPPDNKISKSPIIQPRNIVAADTVTDKRVPAINFPDSNKRVLTVKYTVIAKAYFYNMPDLNTRRRAYVTHWNNTPLNPINDKNGFIYIIFTNQYGVTSKGWLNKKDLRPL